MKNQHNKRHQIQIQLPVLEALLPNRVLKAILKKTCVYMLCISQLFYSNVFAGISINDDVEHPITQKNYSRGVILSPQPGDVSYRIFLKSAGDNVHRISYLFNKEGEKLGILENREGSSHLTWDQESLEVNFERVKDSVNSLFIEARGKLTILNTQAFVSATLKASSLNFPPNFLTSESLWAFAEKASFQSIKSDRCLTLGIHKFFNPENSTLEAPELILETRDGGHNKGALLAATEIFLRGKWSNHHEMRSDRIYIEGSKYHAYSKSTVEAKTLFSVKSTVYEERGSVLALFYQISGESFYLTKEGGSFPRIFAGYMWSKGQKFVGSEKAVLNLWRGATIRSSDSLKLKSQFNVGDQAYFSGIYPDTEIFSLVALDTIIQEETKRASFPSLLINSKQEVDFEAVSQINLKEGRALFEGDRAQINGTISGHTNSRLEIRTEKEATLNAKVLPLQVVVRSPKINLETLPPFLNVLKLRGKQANLEDSINTHVKFLDSYSTQLRTEEESQLELDHGKVQRLSARGKVSVEDTLTVKSAYVENLSVGDHTELKARDRLSLGEAQGKHLGIETGSFFLNNVTVKNLQARASGNGFLQNVSADTSKVKVGSTLFTENVAHDTAELMGGQGVILLGQTGRGEKSVTQVTATTGDITNLSKVNGNASFKVDAGNFTHDGSDGSFEAESTVHIEAKQAWIFGDASPRVLNVNLKDAQYFLNRVLNGAGSVHPEILNVYSIESLDLSGKRCALPFKTILESANVINFSSSIIEGQDSTLKLKAAEIRGQDAHVNVKNFGLSTSKNLYTSRTHINVADYTRTVGGDLEASKEFVRALLNLSTVGGKATFVGATEEGIQQVFEITGETDISEAKFWSKPNAGGSEEERLIPQLTLLSGSLIGKASKKGTGSWSHYKEVVDAQPQLICEGGPTVIMTETGFWLEAPIMKGDTLKYGSMTGDIEITSLALTEIKRWAEQHKKKNWCGQVSRETKTREESNQSLVRPNISSHGQTITSAKKGNIKLSSPIIFVGTDWKVYAKKFGVEAATVAHHFYSQTTSKSSGMLGGASSSHTMREDGEEVVPPVMRVGANLYLYCEDVSIDSAEVYIEKILHSYADRLKFGAQTRSHSKEEHSVSSSFTGKARFGYNSHLKEEVPCNVNIGGIQAKEGQTIISVGAKIHNRDPNPTPLDIQYEELKRQYIFNQYASVKTNYANVGIIAIAALATTIATGSVGGSFAVQYLGAMGGGLADVMCSAAFSSLCSTAATSFLSSGGDFGKTFEDLTSQECVQSILSSAVIAGAMQKVTSLFNLKALPAERLNFSDHLKYHLAHGVATAGVKILVDGKKPEEALKEGALSTALQSMGGFMSHNIGSSKDALGPIWHKVAHGLVGAVTGAISNPDDVKRGLISGAIGAVTAELIAESFNREKVYDKAFARVAADQEAGKATDRATYEGYLREELKGIDFAAKAGAILVASLAKQDVNFAQNTATTAIENNFFPALIVAGMMVYDIYDVAMVFQKEGEKAALNRFLLHAATWTAGGIATKGLMHALKVGKPVLKALLDHIPIAKQAFQRAGVMAYVVHEKVIGTQIGQALHKADRAAFNAAQRITEKVAGRVKETAQRFVGKTKVSRPNVASKSERVASKIGGGDAASRLNPLLRPKTKADIKNPSSSTIEGLDLAGKKPQGNSHQYVGDTHVYTIKPKEDIGGHFKVGESMQGENKLGRSKRAQAQVNRLFRNTGIEYETKIRRTFNSKVEAREWETRLIKKYRELFGDHKLPGNKGVH